MESEIGIREKSIRDLTRSEYFVELRTILLLALTELVCVCLVWNY
jgi:hypothetical protein